MCEPIRGFITEVFSDHHEWKSGRRSVWVKRRSHKRRRSEAVVNASVDAREPRVESRIGATPLGCRPRISMTLACPIRPTRRTCTDCLTRRNRRRTRNRRNCRSPFLPIPPADHQSRWLCCAAKGAIASTVVHHERRRESHGQGQHHWKPHRIGLLHPRDVHGKPRTLRDVLFGEGLHHGRWRHRIGVAHGHADGELEVRPRLCEALSLQQRLDPTRHCEGHERAER